VYQVRVETSAPCVLAGPLAQVTSQNFLGALASQVGAVAGSWSAPRIVATRQLPVGCEITAEATWGGASVVVDPEVAAAVPTVSLVEVRDETEGRVVYDRAALGRRPYSPPIPGQAPAPPPQPPVSSIPSTSTQAPAEPAPAPAPAGAKGDGTFVAVVAIVAVGLLSLAIFARRRS